ncbi:hypothetical protein BO79DRAFT_4549 [Aspergillus costaricaensis CBS 115574]|uniref:Uncharacterized protein n=1 Tax=Aspergillus costaricaensis CBS 115574 TaxID=1448317 RepID=A0ACD1IVJ5_9EURO|nr:hypothetical protein BO79DRAFT_4549 [Aspergillus costaricaensis CBS 115574]RAK94660.1 hypothetical protein BO79DRAFT_4549 [Aspergillus costaricaensis CBS 115574]
MGKKGGMMKLKREKERGKRGAKRRKLIYLSGLDFSMVFVVMGLGTGDSGSCSCFCLLWLSLRVPYLYLL